VNTARLSRSAVRFVAAGVGFATAAYGTYIGVTWFRYGYPKHPPSSGEADPLLDRFMPAYEVAERHAVRVAAPADITLSAACEMDFQQSRIIRVIFKTREFILRSEPEEDTICRGLFAQTKALGWGMLAEVPGREIVMGAVTRPWAANVVFRALPPDDFADFQEPGYVKIVWTLRTDPIGVTESIFRTETRALTTDSSARAKFRVYWSFFSPGILLIRRMMLRSLKREAEARPAR